MKSEHLEKLVEKSKDKEDGTYAAFGRYYYVVKDNMLHLIGDRIHGELLQFSYGFLVTLGKVESYKVKVKLKELQAEL